MAICSLLSVALAACSFSTPDVALTVADKAIPSGLYLTYQLSNYQTAESELRSQGQALKANTPFQDTTAQQHIQEQTVQSIGRYVWIQQEFEKQNLSLTQQEQKTLDTSVTNAYAQMKKLLFENGIGENSYRTFFETEMMYSKLLDAYVKKQEPNITDDDVKKYLDENYVHIRQFTLPNTMADGSALEESVRSEIDDMLTKALEEIQKGADFEATAEKYLKLASEKTKQTYDDTLKSSYLRTQYAPKKEQSFDSDFIKKARNSELKKTAIFDLAPSRILYERIPNDESKEEFEQIKSNAKTELLSKQFDDQIKEDVSKMNIDTTQAQKNFPFSRITTAQR